MQMRWTGFGICSSGLNCGELNVLRSSEVSLLHRAQGHQSHGPLDGQGRPGMSLASSLAPNRPKSNGFGRDRYGRNPRAILRVVGWVPGFSGPLLGVPGANLAS